MVLPVGFWKGAGIPKGPRVNTFIECGCCGAYHRTDFGGDCREDSERYAELPEGAEEVFEEEDERSESGPRCTACGCDLHEGICPEGCRQTPEGED